MIVYGLQFFGGRGAKSGAGENKDWLSMSGKRRKGNVHPLDLQKYKGKSLEEIERRIRRLKHEELFAVDADGKVVAAYKGNSRSVAFPATLLKEEGLTVTHGHPKGYEEFGGTFSFADIDNMLKSNWQEHRATASGQGEMNYIMRRTAQADPQGLRDRINKDYVKLKDKSRSAYKKAFLENLQQGERQARHIARQKQVGVLNAYYKEVFPTYGFEYITRKKEYRYNR